tara:strand:- start:585 stop:779 length:195 start_codon:yes stop_codon:yes gene_type:complete
VEQVETQLDLQVYQQQVQIQYFQQSHPQVEEVVKNMIQVEALSLMLMEVPEVEEHQDVVQVERL